MPDERGDVKQDWVNIRTFSYWKWLVSALRVSSNSASCTYFGFWGVRKDQPTRTKQKGQEIDNIS